MTKKATREAMTTTFTQAIKAEVEGYMKQVPEPSEEDIGKKKRYEAVIELEGAGSTLGKQLGKRIKALAPSYAANKKHRGVEIAEALQVTCKKLGIPIQVKTTKTKTTKKTNSKKRKGDSITPAQMAEHCEQVLEVLPPKGDTEFMPKREVTKQASLDPAAVHVALNKLKTMKQAANNGMRGIKAGWQKA